MSPKNEGKIYSQSKGKYIHKIEVGVKYKMDKIYCKRMVIVSMQIRINQSQSQSIKLELEWLIHKGDSNILVLVTYEDWGEMFNK